MKEEKSHHHFRFYIVMITIVVGIIFLFLVLNDDNSSLSGAALFNGADEEQADSEDITSASLSHSGSFDGSTEKDILLNFDKIPDLKAQTKIEKLELRFENLGTVINVNDDKLELNNLEEVTLSVEDFSGEILLSGSMFSIDGRAKRIEVNDVALYSKEELEISFSDLGYDSLSIEKIELDNLKLPQGDGSLQITDKLVYTLSDDSLELNYFNGELVIGGEGNSTLGNTLNLKGVVKGLSISGLGMNLDLN